MESISALLFGIAGGIFYGKEKIRDCVDMSNLEGMRASMFAEHKKLDNLILIIGAVAIGWFLLLAYNANN